MPSVTDIQQQTSKISLNNDGKSTPPPPSSSSGMTTDSTNVDPVTQVIFALEKKQRNLGKRKDKLESYQQEAKSGKELNKDQKEALAKYGEVLSQIDCVKDLHEQIKKIQVDSNKHQKRLNKQAAEEKRLLISQRLREYAQLRYLLDHRPTTLKSEESSLLDELARVILPSDISLPAITRSVDIVLAIYQGGPLSSTVKTLTNRSSQEVRDILEQLINQFQSSPEEIFTPQQTQFVETVKQTPLVPQPPPSTPASVLPQRETNKQQQSNNNNDALGSTLAHTHLVLTNPNEHPLQFDTRDQNISYHQLMQDSPFFPPLETSNTNTNQQMKQDSSNNQDNTQSQLNDPNHYMQSFNAHPSSQEYTQTSTEHQQQQGMNNYDQENSSNVVHANNMQTDEQQSEEQWQHRRSNNNNNGNNYRGGQYNGNGNKHYNRGSGGPPNNYNQQQWRGPRGGHHDPSYGGGQRPYHENNNGARGGSRGGSNTNYRGNRGGSNYRGGNRGNGNTGYNGNGYQRSSQYQHNNEQQNRPVASNNQQQ